MKKKIILDCDPGLDDAVGIMLVAGSPELDLLGVTVTAGNAPAVVCAKNALRVLDFCARRDVPVYLGLENPLSGTLNFNRCFNGRDGLNNTELSASERIPEKQGAIDFIINTTRLNSGITVVSTAPMGNLAEAIRIAPDIMTKISAILTSSGYFGVRKLEIPPRCTWNIRTDPMAAKIVLESGIEIRAIGLEITSQLSNHMVNEILKNCLGSVRLAFFRKAVEFSRQHQIEPSSLLVDAVAASYAVDSSLAHYVHGKVKMDSQESPNENFTRLYGLSNVGNNSNVFAADSFQFRKYIKMLENRVFR